MTLTLAGVLNLAGPPLLAKVKKSFFCEASLWPIFSLHRLICLLIKYATVRIFYWYLPHTFYIFEKTYWAMSRCRIIRPDQYTYIIYVICILMCVCEYPYAYLGFTSKWEANEGPRRRLITFWRGRMVSGETIGADVPWSNLQNVRLIYKLFTCYFEKGDQICLALL